MPASAAREASQSSGRWESMRFMTKEPRSKSVAAKPPSAAALTADDVHHLVVVDDLPRISVIDDLAAVDRIQPVGNPAGVGEVRLGDQHRELHLLDLVHGVDEP